MGGLTRTERMVIGAIVVATALAGIAHYADWAPLLAFAAATVALAGLAHVVSLATEQVGERFGPAATGLLQSTLGNLPELFVVIFALRAGEVVVAQTSIVGSILANALLVLGLVIVVGAHSAPDGTMRFRARLPNDTATLLLVTSFIIVLVGLAHVTHEPAARHERTISAIAAVALLAVYLAWVVPYVRGGAKDEQPRESAARVALGVSVGLLAAGGVGSAFVSDWFIAALRPSIDQLGVSEAFAGLVVVALAGNAVENVAGVVLAHKGQSDLAISVVKNSVAQIAAFLYPALVLISLLFAHQLTFALAPVLIAALLLTALSMWQITGDGEAVAFEGWALVAIYVILAVFTLYE
jgi:Ca2+:H+ antiporter